MGKNTLEKIGIKKDQISEIEKDTTLLYEELGQSVADINKNRDFHWCKEELTAYCLANDECSRQKNTQKKLNNLIKIIESCNKKIKEINIDLKKERKNIKELLLRFGAAAYEAYGEGKLNEEIKGLVDPLFIDKYTSIKSLETKYANSKRSIIKKYIQSQLTKRRLSLINNFYDAAKIIESNNCLDKIPLLNKTNLLKDYEKSKSKEKELVEYLESCRADIIELKTEGAEAQKKKLEDLKKTVDTSKKCVKSAAILLGEELYKALPNDISSKEVGTQSIEIIDQITLHLRTVISINNDIQLLSNELKVEEIEAQIKMEQSNIERLEKRIETCKNQIDKFELNIQEKKAMIYHLKEEGTCSDD